MTISLVYFNFGIENYLIKKCVQLGNSIIKSFIKTIKKNLK